jgi:nucleoside-diphosphate-sugar epimerase
MSLSNEKMINVMNKRDIVITGGTGFIGGYLAEGLRKDGHRVTTLSRTASEKNYHIQVDLTDQKQVEQAAQKIANVDTVIHCSALAHGQVPENSQSVQEINSLMTQNIFSAFNQSHLHWIFMSSITVYGDHVADGVVPILPQPVPEDEYGKGKLQDELFFRLHAAHLDILRLVPVYDCQNMRDIRKRVFLPKTPLKVNIYPEPKYSICHVREVLVAVNRCFMRSNGKLLTQVGDHYPVKQGDMASWFPGVSIPVPRLLFKVIIFLMPKIFFRSRAVGRMLKKVSLDNVFEIGSVDLDVAVD